MPQWGEYTKWIRINTAKESDAGDGAGEYWAQAVAIVHVDVNVVLSPIDVETDKEAEPVTIPTFEEWKANDFVLQPNDIATWLGNSLTALTAAESPTGQEDQRVHLPEACTYAARGPHQQEHAVETEASRFVQATLNAYRPYQPTHPQYIEPPKEQRENFKERLQTVRTLVEFLTEYPE